MLTIAIPVHDEAPTIGVLLWRLRAMFQEYAREYEVLVFNDGSTDGTAEVLEPYLKALPLTILGGKKHVGYSGAIDALLREASRRTRYPRRDAVILMQGDFTDLPEHIPELVRRFEGGADLVTVERPLGDSMPLPEKRLRTYARWLQRPFIRTPDTADPFGTYRLVRLSIVRDLIKDCGDAPLVSGQGWAANLELYQTVRAMAKRTESVTLPARYDLRPRESRRRPLMDAFELVVAARALNRRTPVPPPRTVIA